MSVLETGLSTLFVSYQSEVRRQVASKLSCKEDIDDIVQEVFLRAHRALSARPVAHPRAYLHQIAHSVVTDHFRRWHRRRSSATYTESLDDDVQYPSDAPTPEEVAVGVEAWESLRAAIDRLPRKAKQALMLRKLEDLTCLEVAERMGVSVKTVEKHLARGMAHLRAEWGTI